MSPSALLERVDAIRQRLAQILQEIGDEIVPQLPAEGEFPLSSTPADILAGVRGELHEAADRLEILVDTLTPRGDDEDEDTRNCCALRALGLLVEANGGAQS